MSNIESRSFLAKKKWKTSILLFIISFFTLKGNVTYQNLKKVWMVFILNLICLNNKKILQNLDRLKKIGKTFIQKNLFLQTKLEMIIFYFYA